MGKFQNLYNHYDEIAISNIMSYRLTASRAAQALVEKGDKKSFRSLRFGLIRNSVREI